MKQLVGFLALSLAAVVQHGECAGSWEEAMAVAPGHPLRVDFEVSDSPTPVKQERWEVCQKLNRQGTEYCE